MPAAKALDKKKLWREIEREERRKKREKLAELRVELHRARALRIRGLAELREAARLERTSARDACTLSKGEAKTKGGVQRRRSELTAEAKFQADLRRIERGNRSRVRQHPHATYVERRSESDDEVRQNISGDLVPLFERVKRGIKGSSRMTRTEAFLKYSEEHPDEVLGVIEDKTEALIRGLDAQYREAARAARRRPRRSPRFSQTEATSVPF